MEGQSHVTFFPDGTLRGTEWGKELFIWECLNVPLFLEDGFKGYRILFFFFLFFSSLITSSHYLLVTMVSNDKSDYNSYWRSFVCDCFLSIAAFKRLSLIFDSLVILCLSLCFWVYLSWSLLNFLVTLLRHYFFKCIQCLGFLKDSLYCIPYVQHSIWARAKA